MAFSTPPAISSPSQAMRNMVGSNSGDSRQRRKFASESSWPPQWSRNASWSAVHSSHAWSADIGRSSRPSGSGSIVGQLALRSIAPCRRTIGPARSRSAPPARSPRRCAGRPTCRARAAGRRPCTSRPVPVRRRSGRRASTLPIPRRRNAGSTAPRVRYSRSPSVVSTQSDWANATTRPSSSASRTSRAGSNFSFGWPHQAAYSSTVTRPRMPSASHSAFWMRTISGMSASPA